MCICGKDEEDRPESNDEEDRDKGGMLNLKKHFSGVRVLVTKDHKHFRGPESLRCLNEVDSYIK